MRLLPLLLGAALALLLGPACSRDATEPVETSATSNAADPVIEDPVVASIAAALRDRSTVPDPGTNRCASCHAEEHAAWSRSQHALANRLTSPAADLAAFDATLVHGSFTTTMAWDGEHPTFTSEGPADADPGPHPALSAIGIEPLVQYLVPFPGGRLQVVDLAHDPHTDEWFNTFGDEDRQPHEWGFWQNRSMNWNTRCAFCHMTGFEKNYDPASDTFASDWTAMGISCTQCHQPHEAGSPAATTSACPEHFGRVIAKPEAIMANCASCHARREELTSDFTPGDAFHDHFRLALLSQPGIYHEDGQVLDENFEYGSFLGSRMHHAGISCLDCHDPHSGDLRLPVTNNALCMSCHAPPGNRSATPVDLLTHSRHPAGSTGAQCVSCHMPETTYMQRDPRRDHGFTHPDPQLTLELGIPNACNRCHTDQDAQWAADHTANWFGEDYNTTARTRARLQRRAVTGDSTVVPELIAQTAAEEIPLWRASLLALLAPWVAQDDVRDLALAELNHDSPLVRAAAINVLAPRPDTRGELARLQADPSRDVRLAAAWADPAGATLPPELAAEQEHWLTVNSDQPAGAIRRGQQALSHQDYATAEEWLRKAVDWDPAAYSHRMLGRVLHAAGRIDEAIIELTRATELDPAASDYPYELALMYAELGQTDATVAQLQRAVQNAPDFGRAWYNLGLAYAGQQKLASALHALAQAEQHLPTSPEPAYAAATIHLRQNNLNAALAATERALALAPNDPGLRGFAQQIRNRLNQSSE